MQRSGSLYLFLSVFFITDERGFADSTLGVEECNNYEQK